MTENEMMNGWTFEETIKTAENLMEKENNVFKWDVLRHLRDFAEHYKEQLEQYRAIGLTPELIEAMQGHNIALINDLGEYQQIGTIDEFKALKEKLQGYKNQMSIYAEQHKVILASDVLDMLEELDWSE